jgi:aldehyde dehydrogenase (NAD+)
VLSIIKFSSVEDAVFKSNDTSFGLGAAVITKDIRKAFKVAHSIKAGTVWVNTYHQYADNVPFGGFKQSGIGREKGQEALDNYLQVKTVFVDTQ